MIETLVWAGIWALIFGGIWLFVWLFWVPYFRGGTDADNGNFEHDYYRGLRRRFYNLAHKDHDDLERDKATKRARRAAIVKSRHP